MNKEGIMIKYRVVLTLMLSMVLCLAVYGANEYEEIPGTPVMLNDSDNYKYEKVGSLLTGPIFYITRTGGNGDNDLTFKIDTTNVGEMIRDTTLLNIRGTQVDSFYHHGGYISVGWHFYLGPCNSCPSIAQHSLATAHDYEYTLTDFMRYACFGYIGIDAYIPGSGSRQITGRATHGMYRLYTKVVGPTAEANGAAEGTPTITVVERNRKSGSGARSTDPIEIYGDCAQIELKIQGCDIARCRISYFEEINNVANADPAYSQQGHNHIYFNKKSSEQHRRDDEWNDIGGSFTYRGQMMHQARQWNTYDRKYLTWSFKPFTTNTERYAALHSWGANVDPTDWDFDGGYSNTGGNHVSLKTDYTSKIVIIVIGKNGAVASIALFYRYHPTNYRYDFPTGWTPSTVELTGGSYANGGDGLYFWPRTDPNRFTVDPTTPPSIPGTDDEIPSPGPIDPIDPISEPEYFWTVNCASDSLDIPFTGIYSHWHDNAFYTLVSDANLKEGFEYLAGLGDLRRAYSTFRPNNMLSQGTANMNSNGGQPIQSGMYNYTKIDEVVDFITGVGVKPVLGLNFMPDVIASCTDPDGTKKGHPADEGCAQGFDQSGYVSLPSDWDDWYDLVYNVMDHLFDRYGADVAVYVWNEAQHWAFNAGGWGDGTYTNYHNMFSYVVAAAAAINSEFPVYGPDYSWVGDYHQFFVNYIHDSVADNFTGFTVHHYDANPLNVAHHLWKAMNNTYDRFGSHIADYSHSITECNPSSNSANTPQNCSRFAAAWMACLVDACYSYADNIQSDLGLGAAFLPTGLTYCDMGAINGRLDERALFTVMSGVNIYKAPVRMNELFSMMGTTRLPVMGNSWPSGALTVGAFTRPEIDQARVMATRTDTSLTVLVYDHDCTDRIHHNVDDKTATIWSRDAYSPNSSVIDSTWYQLTIESIPWEEARLEVFDINDEHADVISLSARNGFPSDTTTLKAYSELNSVVDDTVAGAGLITITGAIQENSVRLYRWTRVVDQKLSVSKTLLSFSNVGSSWTDSLMVYASTLDSTCRISTSLPAWLTADVILDSLTSGDSLQIVFTADSTYAGGYYSNVAVITSNYNNLGVTAVFSNMKPAKSYHVNCGGEAYTASNDTVFAADQEFTAGTLFGYSGGTTFRNGTSIAGTVDDTLYLSERHSMSGYHFRVEPDTFSVVIHLCENWFAAAGLRSFSVAIEGVTAFEEVDLYDQVGQFTALVDTFETVCTDGILDVTFSPQVNNAKVSAIEVFDAFEAVLPVTYPGYSRIWMGLP